MFYLTESLVIFILFFDYIIFHLRNYNNCFIEITFITLVKYIQLKKYSIKLIF